MGYYANSSYTLTTTTPKRLQAIIASGTGIDDADLEDFGCLLNEDSTTEVRHDPDGTIRLHGDGGGKAMSWDDYRTLAQTAAGTINWTDDVDPDERWRIRLANGKATQHDAVVTVEYPTDPGEPTPQATAAHTMTKALRPSPPTP